MRAARRASRLDMLCIVSHPPAPARSSSGCVRSTTTASLSRWQRSSRTTICGESLRNDGTGLFHYLPNGRRRSLDLGERLMEQPEAILKDAERAIKLHAREDKGRFGEDGLDLNTAVKIIEILRDELVKALD